MAVKVGTAFVDIRPDLSQFGGQLRNQVTGDISKVGRDASRSLRDSFVSAGRGAASAFAASFAVIKVKDFLGGAVQAASDLNEQLSKSNTVFGTSGAVIDRWARGAADSIGLSRREALEAAGSFGNMFSQLGFGADQTADMSQQIVQLASDFASFHDADITDVLVAQQAAFRGEYDSLQRFLPLMNAATIETQAMEDTGKKNANQLTAQEKALAAYTLMFSGAGDAAGDFARTHDSLANQQRVLTAQWENMKTEIGEGLMPVMLEFVQLLNSTVIPALQTLFLTSGADATGWAAIVRDAIGDVAGFAAGALSQFARLVANIVAPLPFGDDFVRDMRTGADAIDDARIAFHASTGELLLWGDANETAASAASRLALVTKGYLADVVKATPGTKENAAALRESAKAARDAGAAERDLRRAKADLAKLQKEGAIDEEKIADARERLADATRSAARADRELGKAQREYDEALANANDLKGFDTAQETLADAADNLADARDNAASAHERETEAQKELATAQAGDPDFQDKLADAKDKVADAQDRVATTAEKIATNATAAATAQKRLNDQLGFTKDQIKDIVGFLNTEIKPDTMGQWLSQGGLFGPAPGTPLAGLTPAFALPGISDPLGLKAPTAPSIGPVPTPVLGPPAPASVTTNSITQVFNEKVDPVHVGGQMLWLLG